MKPACYALYGGTFDPFHAGHLAVARAVRDAGLVDEVLIIPSGHPPHRGDTRASAEERWCMAVLATVEERGMRVVRWETERAGEGPTYAYDTLRSARIALGPAVDLAWVIGADALRLLGTWHRIGELVREVRFLVVPRADEDEAWLRRFLTADPSGLPVDRFAFVPMDRVPVSSTAVRERLAHGSPVEGWLPPLVARHVARYGLYAAHPAGAAGGPSA